MKRPYKDAWPLERVTQTIREGAGSHFEPRLVEAFQSILPRILDLKAARDARESALAGESGAGFAS
jgi:putative two-component system response regulator